ncbi:Uncharacterised protein [Vibrio cholerae]|nr:Uncharacterised protein [Vibrio cholerae]
MQTGYALQKDRSVCRCKFQSVRGHRYRVALLQTHATCFSVALAHPHPVLGSLLASRLPYR